jgi:lipopolysaccharide export LptBFGC system permease protein LptF
MYGRLIRGTLAVMAILAMNEMFYKTKDLYRLVIAGVISVRELLTVWVTLLPVIFYQVAPEMVALAVLARYYFWRQDNEVLAQRTVGRSCWQIASPAILVAVCAAIFTASMSLYALPVSIGIAEDIRAAAALRINPSMLDEGVQNQILPSVSISFQSWHAANVIDGVVLTDDRRSGEHSFVIAQQGHFVETAGDYVLLLDNGDSFTYSGTGSEMKHLLFNQLAIPLSPDADSLPVRYPGYYEADIGTLLNPSEEIRQNRSLWAASVAEGHHRIINPLRCIGCVLLVLGILVPGQQGYAELIVRLVLALSLTFAENTASTIAFSAAQRDVGGGAFLYLLPGVSGSLGALLLYRGDMRLHRWSRLRNLLWPARKEARGERMRNGVGPSRPITVAARSADAPTAFDLAIASRGSSRGTIEEAAVIGGAID